MFSSDAIYEHIVMPAETKKLALLDILQSRKSTFESFFEAVVDHLDQARVLMNYLMLFHQ